MKETIIQTRLRPPSETDMAAVVEWRAAVRPYMRTPVVLSLDQQVEFYREVLRRRDAPHRYWMVDVATDDASQNWRAAGMGGLTFLDWENGRAEVSLIVDGSIARHGCGSAAFGLLLDEAFDTMRLDQVVAECYAHNPALGFWHRMAERFGAEPPVSLPARKFWGGQWHDGVYFCWRRRRVS